MGAIFSQGFLSLDSCTFKNNTAYRNGENVLCIKKTDVYLEGIKLKSSADVVTIKDVTSTWDKVLKYGYMALSAIVGVVVGVTTLNPVAGVAAGGGTAAVLGPLTGTYLYTRHYDVHYNALKGTLILTAEGITLGVIGGLVGAYGGQLIKSMGGRQRIVIPIYEDPEGGLLDISGILRSVI